MFGNGVKTSMVVIAVIARRILLVLLEALTACAVVVLGMILRGPAACRTGTATRLASRTPPLACALPFLSKSFFVSIPLILMQKTYHFVEASK